MVKDAPRRAFMGRTVHFCDDGASILATFLETHEMCVESFKDMSLQLMVDIRACYTIEPWTLKWSTTIKNRM